MPIFWKYIKKYGLDKTASILPITALVLPFLAGMTAVGTDLSYWMMKKRDLQTAADAAAIAAAYEYKHKIREPSFMEAAAQREAINNGYNPDADGTLDIQVLHEAGASRVQVTLRERLDTFFAHILMGQEDTYTSVTAIAEVSGAPLCVMSLSETGAQSMLLNSNASLNIPGCAIHVNSDDGEALVLDSFAEIVEADRVCVNGDYLLNSNSYSNPAPHSGCGVLQDPYADLEPPPAVQGGCEDTRYRLRSNSSDILSPGRYCNGLSIGSNSNAHFEDGIYVIDGGTFNVDSNAEITGENVMFYITENTTIDFNSYARVSLSAPTTGDYANMLIVTDRDNTEAHQLNSNLHAQLTGAIYFPNATYRSDSNATIGDGGSGCLQIVAQNVEFSSQSGLDFTPDPDCPLYGEGGSSAVKLVF